MKAKVTIRGSRIAGYRVTVTLPLRWCENFGEGEGFVIAGEDLKGRWGTPRLGEYREYSRDFVRLEDAKKEAAVIVDEIRAADAALRAAVPYAEETEIELGE